MPRWEICFIQRGNGMMKKKESTSSSALKATIWYLICDFFLKGISFITMPIFTRILTPGEIGKYSVLTSWISIFSVVVTLNLVQSVFLAKFDYKEYYQEFVSTVTILGMLAAGLVYIVCISFRAEVASFLGIDLYAFDVMMMYLIFCQISSILIAKYRANFEYKKSIIVSISSAIIVTAVAIVCTFFSQDALKGRIYGTYISHILINIVLFTIIYKRGAFKWEYCKYAMAICTPLIIHNLAGNVMHSSDRVMIGKLCSDEEAGLYGVAYTCAMFANILRNSMNTAWNPWVYEKINGNETDKIRKASYLYLVAFLVLCMGIIILAPEILYILGGSQYQQAKYVVPPVVTAYMFSMVYSLYAGIEQYYKKQKNFALISIICALLNVVLNFILIPRYGYIAAAYTTLASTALECFLHYVSVRKMKMHHIYNGKFNIVILSLMVALSSLSIAVYQNTAVRYLIVCAGMIAVLIIGILKRHFFIGVLGRIIHK